MPYLGTKPTQAGSFIFIDDIASNFNGSATAFNLQVGGVAITPNTQNLLIALDGVIQQAPDAYTVSGSTITFSSAVPSNTDFYGILMGQSASVGQGTIGADELKITGNGTSGQSIISDGDSTFSYTNHLPLAGGTMSGAINLNSQNITNGGTITGTFVGDVTGNVTGNLTGTIQTASQTNITSVGTLSSLTLGGDLLVPQYIKHVGDTDNHIEFGTDEIKLRTGDSSRLIARDANVEIYNTLVGTSANFTGAVTATGSDYMIKSVSTSTTNGDAIRISAETGIAQGKIELDFFNSSSTAGGGYGMIQVGKTANTPPLSIMASGLGVGRVPTANYKADFYKADNSCNILLESNGYGSNIYFAKSGTTTGQIEFNNSGESKIVTRTATNLRFGVNDSTALVIDTNQKSNFSGNIDVDTGGTTIVTIDGNNNSGDDGRLILKGHTAQHSRALIHLNNGVSSGGLDWRIGCLRYSNAFVLSLDNDDYNNSTNVFAVDGNRKIGIGTDPGSAKITVSGKIYSDTNSQFSNAVIGNVNISGTNFAMFGSNSTSRGMAFCRDGSSSLADLRIEGNGDVQIGGQALVLGTNTSSTDRLLRIARFASNSTDLVIGELRFTGSSDGGHAFAGLKTFVHHTNGRGRLEFFVNDASTYAERMTLNYDGNLSVDGTLSESDATLKKNVKTITSALDTVNNLRGVTYNWKASTGKDTDQKHYGMIAQEVEELLPELVKDYGNSKKKQLNYTSIIPVLVESIKELTAKVNALEGN